jgi:hypothetical protein
MLMVDDNAENATTRPHNYVPILPFAGDADDLELPKLSNYLVKLTAEPQLLAANMQHFKLMQAAKAPDIKASLDVIFESRSIEKPAQT